MGENVKERRKALHYLRYSRVLTNDLRTEVHYSYTYSRRGYAGNGNNTNDLVWNARLTKTFTKAGVTPVINGFDILGNISNISQLINSLERTETYRNSLHSYVMFYLIYRLNKQSKRK